ncbi:MAG: uncharacterized protein JWN04_1357 [Myxococcaceae bacterium]|nr:uncharacterized protein [Myxococcaceae bacterium]
MSFSRRCAELALTLLTCLAQTAEAQTCHTPALRASDDASWRTSASAIFATFSNTSYTGEYQGVQAKAAFLHPRISLEVSLPYYRLERNGLSDKGIGDVATSARVAAYRSADRSLSVGPELALTLPSGNASHDLGMGHVMLMPGAWLRLQEGKLSMIAQLAYGRSATSLNTSGHHHEAVFPIVNPMNMQEIEHALSAGYAVHPNVGLDLRLLGAVPVHAPMGTAREVIAGGLRANAGSFDFGAEVQVPLVGAIFHAKTLLSVAAQW